MAITKNVAPSIEVVLKLSNQISFNVSIDGLQNHQIHNCTFDLKKGDRQFDFKSSTPIRLGIQSYKDLQIDRDELVRLDNGAGLILFTKGQNVLVNHIAHDDNKTKIFNGGISMFSTVQEISSMDSHYYRYVVPVGSGKVFKIWDFQRLGFKEKVGTRTKESSCVKLDVDGEMHLFDYSHNKSHYLIIDCFQEISIVDFQKKCFCILLALGFIKGNFIHDECFIFSYDNDQMKDPTNVLYSSVRASINTQKPLFVTNYYPIYENVDYLRDENGIISVDDPLYKRFKGDIMLFPDVAFSNLSKLCFNSEKIQRAILIFIDAHAATLEIKIPTYYVAIEAIAGHIAEERKKDGIKMSVAPIKNNKIANELISELKEMIRSKQEAENINDDEFIQEILFKNIDRLNSPPNADKLKEAFSYVNYDLNQEQKKLLIDRNTYLHGSFLKIVGDDELFKKGLHSALKLELMIAILIFRLSHFSGPILNYSAIWSDITDLGHNEERVLDI